MKIGIIGAGLIGLVAGRKMALAGHEVTVLEQECEAGGLAGTFEFEGTRLEKFYHHYFTTDLDTVDLIRETGLQDKMIWKETPMGVFTGGKTYSFSTPLDLLRFSPLSFFNRLRFGIMTLLLSLTKNWRKFENIRAEEWLKKYYGMQAWKVMWGPLLNGKFGKHASEIGMPWFYSRIHTRAGSREKGMTKESLGYLQGSMQILHEALKSDIEKNRGRVWFGNPVKAIEIKNNSLENIITEKEKMKFDFVLSTIAPEVLLKLLPEKMEGDYWKKLAQSQYIGNVCAVITLKRSLSPIYWMNIPDQSSPFIAVIEHTNFIDKSAYNNKHVLYLSSYVPVDHPRYLADEKTVLKEFYDYLKKIISDFSEDDVEKYRLFKAPYAQPIIRAGYAENIIPIVSPVPGFLLANMSQIYPEDRGMSYSIKLGRRAAEEILCQIKN